MKGSFLKRINLLKQFPIISLVMLVSIALTLGLSIQNKISSEVFLLLGIKHLNEIGIIIWVGIGLSFLFIYIYIQALFRSTSHGLVLRSEENAELLDQAKKQLFEKTKIEEELKRNYQIQTLLSSLLRVPLTNLALDEQLDEILNQINTISWLDMKSQGCIYLFDEAQDLLVMNAYIGLPGNLINTYQNNPDNLCLCGQVMGTGEGYAIDKKKVRHHSKSTGNLFNVHYYLPINHGNKFLGVINLLISGTTPINEKEDEFFNSVADVLAGIIEQRRTDAKLNQTVSTLRTALGGTIHAMALTVETRDPYTAGHQRRVSNLARAIATEMGLSKDQIEGTRIAGIVHDLGKISVPSEILSKPGEISSIEHLLIHTHPQKGYDILESINFPWPIAQMVLQHHERINGSGYPAGLKNDEILMEARVLAVADVVEAMASHRPYRPSRGIQLAMEEITEYRGILYDPQVVDACLKLFLNKGFKFDLPADEVVTSEDEYNSD